MWEVVQGELIVWLVDALLYPYPDHAMQSQEQEMQHHQTFNSLPKLSPLTTSPLFSFSPTPVPPTNSSNPPPTKSPNPSNPSSTTHFRSFSPSPFQRTSHAFPRTS